LLDRPIGNFFERVIVLVFLVLLFLLFCGDLFVAFCTELAATLAVSRLGVSWHYQYRDYRSYREGSHRLSPNNKKRAKAIIEIIMAKAASISRGLPAGFMLLRRPPPYRFSYPHLFTSTTVQHPVCMQVS
jgi:hypothetical protein